eukprot:1531548-Ditylum_brightwellii.AAC.1
MSKVEVPQINHKDDFDIILSSGLCLLLDQDLASNATVTIAEKRGELVRSIVPLIVAIHASHTVLLMEEAKSVEEDKDKDGALATGVVVAHSSNNRNRYTLRQESHISILQKALQNTGVVDVPVGRRLMTSKAQGAAATAEAAGTISADGTLTSDAHGDTLSGTVAAD